MVDGYLKFGNILLLISTLVLGCRLACIMNINEPPRDPRFIAYGRAASLAA